MRQSNQMRVAALCLLALCGALLYVAFQKSPALPALTLLPPGPMRAKSVSVLDRLIPYSWRRRTRRFFLGPPRQIVFHIEFVELSNTVASIVAQNSLGQPQAASNGVAGWILRESAANPVFTGAATVVAGARCSVEQGMEASVATVNARASYSADLIGRLGRDAVDQSSCLTITLAGKTNFVAASRAQVPFDQSLFMLDASQPESCANRWGIVMTADEIDSKGVKVRAKAK